MFRILILLSVVLFVSACERFDRPKVPDQDKYSALFDKKQFQPRAWRKQIYDFTPGGDSSYDQGFQDGCQTFTNVLGEGLYRLNGPRIEPDRLVSDAWYLRGYQDASSFCTFNLDWETH